MSERVEWQQTGERSWRREYDDGTIADVTPGRAVGWYRAGLRYPRDWRMWGLQREFPSPDTARERTDDEHAVGAEARRRWVEACRTDGMQREGGPALIVQHCAVFGRLERPVREFRVGYVLPYAQHPISVEVRFVEPRKRTGASFTMVPDDSRYLTVEVEGRIVYDSRVDVPCDRGEWEATAARFAEAPAVLVNGARVDPPAAWVPEWRPPAPIGV